MATDQQLTASLPMYALPEQREANAALWRAIADGLRRAGVAAPALSAAAARDEVGPATLFTQNCGYPLQTRFEGRYRMLGAPDYDAPGCGERTHRAFVVVRAGSGHETLADLRGGVFAVNGMHSNTGMNLPRRLFAEVAGGAPMFRAVVQTGGHVASLAQVAAGAADAASIDCVTYAFVADHRPAALAGLRVLAETAQSPTLPFVTAAETAPATAETLRRALSAVARPVLAPLRIRSIGAAEPARYARLLEFAREAAALGYPELR